MLEQIPETKNIFDAVSTLYPELNVSVRIIDQSSFLKTAEENLQEAGVIFDSILRFNDPSIKNLKDTGYTMINAGGFATNYIKDNLVGTSVFLSQEPLGIKETDSPSIYWALQTIILYHELMHAKDLQLQKNFNRSTMTVNLVKAEIYADTKTLRFFENHKKAGGDTYRNLYAAGILGRENAGIYKQIFNGITKSFPKAQLQAWASMSLLPPSK